MTISASSLTSGFSSTSGTSFSTASITPTANRLVLIAIELAYHVPSASQTLTVTGNGLTWVEVARQDIWTSGVSFNGQLVIFRAMGASPTTGAITITSGSTTVDMMAWSVVQFSGIDTTGTNGSGAIVQNAKTKTDAASATVTATLAAFGSANNATFAAVGVMDSTGTLQTVTPRAGFTEIHDTGVTYAEIETQFLASNSTTVSGTCTAVDYIGIIGLEIKAGSTAYSLPTTSGSFSDTGRAPRLAFGRKANTVSGSFSETGRAAGFLRTYVAKPAAASFSETGNAGNTDYGRRLNTVSGAFTQTGYAQSLNSGYTMVVSPYGQFSITAGDNTLIAPRRLMQSVGLFGLTGGVPSLDYGRRVSVASGSFAKTGHAVSMNRAGGTPTSPVRYIRETMNGATSGNPTNYWVEIQAKDGNGVNVALNKTVTVGYGTVGEGTLPLLVDGDTNTNNYVSVYDPNGGVTPCSVQIDLGAVYSINSITRWHYYGDGRTFIQDKVEVSVDGVTWVTIFDSEVNGRYAETSAGKTSIAPFGTTSSLTIQAVAGMFSATGNAPALSYSGNSTVTYIEDTTTDFTNPERGFMHTIAVDSGYVTGHAASEFQGYINSGYTLVRFLVYLNAWVSNATLPSSFVNNVVANTLANMRSVGFKCIIRFSYEQSDTGNDATKTIMLGHIDQLAPILTQYADVIVWQEAGFIGSWGEWAHSNNFGTAGNGSADQGITPTQWADRKQVIERILSQTPSTYLLAIRTPMCKKNMYGTTPLQDSERFNGTYRARIGHHNDAFLSDSSDQGTYFDQSDKDFVAQESKWLPWDGETDHYPARVDSNGAISEMQTRTHSRALNADYQQQVLSAWQTEGNYSYISAHFGYRLYLVSSSMPNSSAPGRTIPVTLQIHNRGFGAPVRNRPIKIVFKSASNTYICDLTGFDMREWLPTGATPITVSGSITLPQMVVGTYNVSLYMPDSYATLSSLPVCAIRMANQSMWDGATGYNSLSRTMAISNQAGVTMTTFVGTFTDAANAPALRASRRIAIPKATYAATGYASAGFRNVILHAAGVGFSATTPAARIYATRRMAIPSGSFVFTGNATNRQSAVRLQADTGVFGAFVYTVNMTGPTHTRDSADIDFFRWTNRR